MGILFTEQPRKLLFFYYFLYIYVNKETPVSCEDFQSIYLDDSCYNLIYTWYLLVTQA